MALVLLVAAGFWMFRGGAPAPPPEAPASGVAVAPHDKPQPARDGAKNAPGQAAAPIDRGPAVAAPKLDAVPPPRAGAGAEHESELEKTIRRATESTDPAERAAAISDLAGEDFDIVLPIAELAAKDPDQDVKLAVLRVLEQMEEAAPVDLLSQLADDPDPEIRMEVLSIVERLSEEDSVPMLVEPILSKGRRDPDEDVRDRAVSITEYIAALRGEETNEEN
jgi:hypothetical protein